ncbi:sensor histidine kinase [Nocardia stercoris]|uniref:histidine kinase n=1 Tax=Nocardia stercoris TaxID=2483361 RepID=A0A3M2L3N0_9NOCA|nr:histidine kinase [Nocardia stercoris]RMI31310.1 sensor histidine kinase [Nocardia stercoris]
MDSSRNERIVDAGLVALAMLGGLYVLIARPGDLRGDSWVPGHENVRIGVDLALGALAGVLVWLRRRWPTAVALGSAPLLALSLSAGVAAFVTLHGVAARRPAAVVFSVAAVHQLAIIGYVAIWQPGYPIWAVWLVVLLEQTALLTAGMSARARRLDAEGLRERLAAAETERRLSAERARLAERTRIAQEMHDVLAHRISLIALHAGALEVRTDLPAEQVGASAGLIRGAAHQALQELRSVIGVLYDGGPAPHAPQPTLADIAELVAESRQAGMAVELELRVPALEEVPAGLGRDGYRIVREALTNVRKHAPGCAATVELSGSPGAGLAVRVANPLPRRSGTVPGSGTMPGSGTGLAALTERVELAGGRIRHGVRDGGEFVVEAELRWER